MNRAAAGAPRTSWRGPAVGALIALGLVIELTLRGPLGAEDPQVAEAKPTEASWLEGYDVLHYAADLTVDVAAERVSGRVAIELRSVGQELRQVRLDAGALDVASVSDEAGRPLVFERRDRRLVVSFAEPLAAGRTARLDVVFTGHPDRGVRFAADQVFTFFHTSSWLVCRDIPGDKATLDLALTVPAGLAVVAPGRAAAEELAGEGWVRHRFVLDRPYPPYLYGFAAARFAEAGESVGDVRLRYLGAGVSSEELRRIFAPTGDVLRFLATKAGTPYPGESYTQVLLPGAPAQEMAAMAIFPTAYGRGVLADPTEDYLIVHELAHQWWGNLVTCATWSDFWLNEAVPVFLVAAYKEERWGPGEVDRERYLARRRYERALAEGASRPLAHDGWSVAEDMSGPLTYSRGALVLHYLRHALGDAAFWGGLQRFVGDAVERGGASGATVTSADLVGALSAAAGRPLEPELDPWIRRGDMPRLHAEHREAETGIEITVEQGGEPWPLELDLAVQGSDGRSRRRVRLDQRRQSFVVPLAGELRSVRVDDGGYLPRLVDHPRPPAMLAWQAAHEPDALGRAEALDRLAEVCSETRLAGCPDPAPLAGSLATKDPDRLVRQVAARWAERLGAPAGGRE